MPPLVEETYNVGDVSVSLKITVADETCESSTVVEATCNDVFDAMISDCSTSGGEYHGGQLSEACLDYIF